jgi:peptidoglycan/LPS O-acetylase OafA/YrhL
MAAFAVLYGHARTLFLTSATGTESLHVKLLYLLSGYGHLAVMVFFVLSGYLVGGTVIRACRDGRWSWGDYLLRRGTRLYIVLIPALVLTLCWDYGEAAQSAGLTPNNDTAVANIRSGIIQEHTSAAIFAGNVAFLQTVVVPPLGSNTPLWSLTNEFWYYLVFPLVWIAVARSGVKFWVRTAYLVIASAILLLLGKLIAIYFAIWLCGALVSLSPEVTFLQRNTARRITTATVAGGLLALLLIVKVRHGLDEIMTDSLVAMIFAVLIYCMKHNRLPSTHASFRRVTAFFADFSYTLYLVHLPPLIFLRACLTYETAWTPVVSSWLMLAGIVGGVVLYAYSISLITERQTEPLRRWLSQQFRPPKRQEHQLAPMEVAR